MSVFLQVKLAEIESLAGATTRPNACRTAVRHAAPLVWCSELECVAHMALLAVACVCWQVAFGLLDILINKLSTFSDTLMPLRTELLQSVYPVHMLKVCRAACGTTASV